MAHFLEYVSHVPEVSYSQIWDINVVQNRTGEPKCPKMANISDLGTLGKKLKRVSQPRAWFVGLINTTKVTIIFLLAYSFKCLDGQ